MPHREKQGITVAAFAREVGVRPQTVRDRVKSGRMARAVLDDGSLDPVRARVDWFANTNPNKARPRASDVEPKNALKRDADDAETNERDLKLRQLAVNLEASEINLEKLRRSTVDKGDAARAVRALMRMHRNAIVNFASRYGPEIAAECGADERALVGALESRLRTVLNDAANTPLPFDGEEDAEDEGESAE